MSPIILAILPIFGLILLGFVLRRLDFPGIGFWPVSERLTYYVLFPAMLVSGLAGRHFDGSAMGIGLTLASAICLVGAFLVLTRTMFNLDGPVFTSVFQGAIRPNTYVGLSAAAALLGPDWMTLSAVALLTLIPLVNVLCVLVLSRHGKHGGGLGRVGLELLKNPLILACVAGLILSGLNLELPGVVLDLLTILGKAALPLGLLAVGAGLQFEGIGATTMPVGLASLSHLVALPLAAYGCARLFGVEGLARDAALIYTAIPVSVSAFILARQMGGDHRVMALIITAQTVLSAVTMPLILALLGS
ncbi:MULTISPECIES: AEC family transporter [unclassified Pseudodesulfovibrio]|uniref:AEC family transporter n=1 Tax=unclassified Pseudodesulfovibrio TaxID=2661612 RepID=UPI000FEC0BA8|nr:MULTISPECIES: AEC family transporter [unclassified Pseudodesulfovibrio]MCJ2164296.1 AEC family transporter [Pseudodesulfovibrio sp. S3-i]RWU04507.1 AEC family transporter [Pseudodesulfovibrio sp. S3]